jgi:outer membrane protein TolC
MQAVQSQIDAAREVLTASRRIAENTPIALKAARDAEQQATARYRSGLASVDAVAEAERLLAQAENDDAVARLNVRRAELLLARAVGDLSPFLNELRGGR